MFSVVIPLYNKEKYIQKAVQSVLDQTYSNFELIVIDDGSTDLSLSKLEIFNDVRIKIISQENAGVSKARNFAVEVASFEYIAFLDADDWWHKDFLLEMESLISEFSNAAVYSSSYFKVKNGKNISANIGVTADFKRGYINYYEVYSNTFWVPVNCSFVVVKKTIFEELGGFNSKLKFGEDLDLWVRFSLKNKFAFINKCLAYSNQDVEVNSRALGNKLWKKEEHVIFNLDYLAEIEKNNSQLKFLLDGLRIRSLHNFYRKKENYKEVLKILSKIDFSKQDFIYYFYYKFPRFMTEFYFGLKVFGSRTKQNIIKMIKN